jgi:opacity protein-like surface antigen
VTSAFGGRNNLDFAFAAMAGVGYRFSVRWMLDAGYRSLPLGNAETDGNATIDELSVKDIQAHEIRFDVRYDFQ